MKILHVDTTNTGRWYEHTNGEVVVLGENNIGFTCNCEELSERFEAWSNDKSYEDTLSHQMVEWLEEISKEETLNESMSVAFPAEIQDEVQDSRPPMDELLGEEDHALADPIEVGIGEEMDLDTVAIPGLPMKEAERRKAWKSLPQRVRIGVRRLHRQFGHVPIKVMTNMLRAAKLKLTRHTSRQLNFTGVRRGLREHSPKETNS